MRYRAATLLALLLIVAIALFAGDADGVPIPAPTLVMVNGAQAAIVPAPPSASTAEVRAVAAQSAENLRNVATGEITVEQATRDPAKSPDAGSGYVFFVVGIVAAAALKFATDLMVLRAPGMPDSGITFVGMVIVAGISLGAWALLRGEFPDLPQSWIMWVGTGITGAGLAGGARSYSRMRTEVIQSKTGQYPQRRSTDGIPPPSAFAGK